MTVNSSSSYGGKMDYSYLEKNLEVVIENTERSAIASGRCAKDILIMPAVKYATAEQINFLHENCGVCDFGENRVQQLLEHWEKLSDKENIHIHFIGSLQTNKVKYIIDKVHLIHSLDSEKLAYEIDKQAKKCGRVISVLVEINSGREESKGGVLPESAEEFCILLSKFENLKLCGFMTMAPKLDDKKLYHEYFSQTKKLCDRIWYDRLGKSNDYVLSMGMSGSYDIAVEEGSTLIRVGGVLFKSEN